LFLFGIKILASCLALNTAMHMSKALFLKRAYTVVFSVTKCAYILNIVTFFQDLRQLNMEYKQIKC